MKKQSVFIFSLFLLTPVMSFAQTETRPINQNQKSEIRQQIQERVIELKGGVGEKRDEIRALLETSDDTQKKKLPILAQERVRNSIFVLFERLEATAIRQEKIIARIEARIEVLKQEGQLAEGVEANLEQAKLNLQKSIALIAASKQELLDRLSTEISIEQIRLGIQIPRESLIDTHVQLVQLVQTLKISEE